MPATVSQDGAFDEAVKDVDAILHLASPMTMEVTDPQEIIGPAVAGTTSILTSALGHGNAVKRFVYTSTTGAVASTGSDQQFRVFSEEDWNAQDQAR